MGVTYPAEPWPLTGHAYVGLFVLKRGDAPPPHSARTPVLRFFGRTLVTAAYFVYEEPSPLTYNEIMSTLMVRRGLRLQVSITHIWVDSPDSRDGGRDLWAIPKDLAEFTVEPHESYLAHGIGSLKVKRTRRLPVPVPALFHVAQDRDGEVISSPVRGTVRPVLTKAEWTFDPDGALGFLAGRRPFLTLGIRPFNIRFGRKKR